MPGERVGRRQVNGPEVDLPPLKPLFSRAVRTVAWIPSEAADVDHGQFVGRCLNDYPVVMDLHERSPFDRRATGRQDWRRLERFAEVCRDLPDLPRIGDERDESDVTAMTALRSCCPISSPQPPHFCRGTSAFLPRLISIPTEPVPFFLLFFFSFFFL
jgi:hypothetical protein